MSRKTERLTHRHRKLLRNSITQTAYANDAPPASPAEVLSLLDDAAELDAARDEIAGLKRAYEAEISARLGGEG